MGRYLKEAKKVKPITDYYKLEKSTWNYGKFNPILHSEDPRIKYKKRKRKRKQKSQ